MTTFLEFYNKRLGLPFFKFFTPKEDLCYLTDVCLFVWEEGDLLILFTPSFDKVRIPRQNDLRKFVSDFELPFSGFRVL